MTEPLRVEVDEETENSSICRESGRGRGCTGVGTGRQLLSRNVERFRGGLVVKAHRLLHHSRLGSNVKKKKGRYRRTRRRVRFLKDLEITLITYILSKTQSSIHSFYVFLIMAFHTGGHGGGWGFSRTSSSGGPALPFAAAGGGWGLGVWG